MHRDVLVAMQGSVYAFKARENRIHRWVAKDVQPATRREDNDGHLSATQTAELTSLPEKTAPYLRKRDQQGIWFLYFLDNKFSLNVFLIWKTGTNNAWHISNKNGASL